MNPNSAIQAPQTIVFDFGGVLARISHSWEDAARTAGVACANLSDGNTGLAEVNGFDEYQAATIDLNEYLARLAAHAGCSPDDALALHHGILIEEYNGVKELVDELHARGCRTGCLSNTNEPHWEKMTLSGKFPALMSLGMKMASFQVGLNKPDPKIFELYCERYDLEPSDIAYFDDYQVNVDSAVKCGWNARRIDPSQDTPTQMRAYLAELGVISGKVIA